MTYLPHTASWFVLSACLALLGLAGLLVAGSHSAPWLLVLMGVAGLSLTVGRCVAAGLRSDVKGVRVAEGVRPRAFRSRVRFSIALLHLLQPLARLRGRIRGLLEPPPVAAVAETIPSRTSRPVPTLREAWTALRLLGAATSEQRFWSERWLSVDGVLGRILDALRTARISHRIDLDDGWSEGRDVSVALGRWAFIDLGALVEEHAQGRVLVRIRLTVRPTALIAIVATLAFVTILASSTTSLLTRTQGNSLVLIALGVATLALGVWRAASLHAGVVGVVRHALEGCGATAVDHARGRLTFNQDLGVARHVGRSLLASVFVVGLGLGGGALMRQAYEITLPEVLALPSVPVPRVRLDSALRSPRLDLAVAPTGELYLSDGQEGVIRRVDASTATRVGGAGRAVGPTVRFDSPGGVAVSAKGDLYVADSREHRAYRIDRLTGTAKVVAGAGQPGFSGDGGLATRALLDYPTAVAFDRDGNIFIADAGNHRVRRIDRLTGVITTVAGGGKPRPLIQGDDGAPATEDIGDGGPAIEAILNWPSDIAVVPSGDLLIADTEHHRVRRVSARTGFISTIAGDGTAALSGDGGPATEASLSAPTGLAVAVRGRQFTLYIADSLNGRVRVVSPDRTISTLAVGDAPVFVAPARLAYDPRGRLYVADARRNGVTAVTLSGAGGARPLGGVRPLPVRRVM